MTLVVGCGTPEIGFLVADTLLSAKFELKKHRGPVDGKFHALKIHVLNGRVAIAYAGHVETALELINKIQFDLGNSPELDIGNRLFQSYTNIIAATGQNPPECEFLVLQIGPKGKELLLVSRHGVSSRERAYIGDSREYQRLMKLRTPYRPPVMQSVQQPDGSFLTEPLVASQGELEFAEISDAMEALTNQRKGDSVGAISGCITRVVDARISGELEYLPSVEASISPWEDHSGFSMLVSNSGRRGIGIYYRTGKMGFLFIVGDSEPCRKEYDETLSGFIRQAGEKYGLTLVGGTWTDEP